MKETIWLAIFTVGWLAGLYIVGPSIFLLFVILYSFLAIIDVALWYYLARRDKRVSSVKMQEWTMKKILNLVFIWVIAIVFWHLGYLIKDKSIVFYVGVIPLIVCWWHLIIEFTSIGENYKKLHWTTERENKVMDFFLKILWLWLDKSLEVAEKKITEKINNLASKTVKNGK